MKTALLLTAAWLLAACGAPEVEKRDPKAVDTADLTQASHCGQDAAALAEDPALRRVPADQLRLLNGETQQTLCDLLKTSGKKALVLQFASVRCYSCSKWIDQVANGLDRHGYGDGVLSVVVITDNLSTLGEEDAKRMKREVARKAIWVHDFYGDLWSFFGTEPWDPGSGEPVLKPLLVAMDTDARGFYTEDTTLDGAEVAALAEKLLGIPLKP